MPYTSEQYLTQSKALLPRGRLWESLVEPGTDFEALLQAMVDELARIDIRVDNLLDETDPRKTLELLDEWEQFAGLPDACAGSEDTLQARRSALHARLTSVGGQTIDYLIQRAANFGHTITINETIVSLSGVLVAGDELSAAHSDRYAFTVNVPIDNTYNFVAGVSVAGDELGYWQPLKLECLLERLKPAHTLIIWNYITI